MLPVPAVVIVKSALEGAVNVEPIEVMSAKSSLDANSSADAPALTLSTCPAVPIDSDAPIPPFAKLIKSAAWNSANPVATPAELYTVLIGVFTAIINLCDAPYWNRAIH